MIQMNLVTKQKLIHRSGFLDAATLALDATLEMTVLRVERSRTEGRNLPVI